jgi:hypothetical protein
VEGLGLTVRAWYLGRAIPWPALLGCCATGALVTGVLHRWPDRAWLLLPLGMAACVAGCGFLFDDTAVTVTAVTPRGSAWRATTRLAAGSVPVGVWTLLVATAPGSLALDVPAWVLAGASVAAVAAGAAAVAGRRQQARPGPAVAGTLVLATLVPLMVGPFLDWESVFPFGGHPGWVVGFWAGVLGAGALLVGWALRPGLRP